MPRSGRQLTELIPTFAIVALVAACTGSGAAPSTAIATASPATIASPTASVVPSRTPVVVGVPTDCSEDARCSLEPGDYKTTTDGFMPGLRFTLGIPWSTREHWQSEFELDPVQPVGIGEVRMWVDMAPGGPTAVADPKRQFDAKGMVDWITTNPELAVSSKRSDTVGGQPATVVDWTVAPTASSGADEYCKAGCALTLGRPHVNCCIGYGPGEHVREYVLDIGPANERHTMVIDLDSESGEKLDQLDDLLHPILETMIFPEEWHILCGRTGPPNGDCSQ
jgi:hypothetical protein